MLQAVTSGAANAVPILSGCGRSAFTRDDLNTGKRELKKQA